MACCFELWHFFSGTSIWVECEAVKCTQPNHSKTHRLQSSSVSFIQPCYTCARIRFRCTMTIILIRKLLTVYTVCPKIHISIMRFFRESGTNYIYRCSETALLFDYSSVCMFFKLFFWFVSISFRCDFIGSSCCSCCTLTGLSSSVYWCRSTSSSWNVERNEYKPNIFRFSSRKEKKKDFTPFISHLVSLSLLFFVSISFFLSLPFALCTWPFRPRSNWQ